MANFPEIPDSHKRPEMADQSDVSSPTNELVMRIGLFARSAIKLRAEAAALENTIETELAAASGQVVRMQAKADAMISYSGGWARLSNWKPIDEVVEIGNLVDNGILGKRLIVREYNEDHQDVCVGGYQVDPMSIRTYEQANSPLELE